MNHCAFARTLYRELQQRFVPITITRSRIRSPCSREGETPTFKDVQRFTNFAPFHLSIFSPNFFPFPPSFLNRKRREGKRLEMPNRFSKTDVSRESSLRSCLPFHESSLHFPVFVGAETRPKFRRSEQSCGSR